MEAKDILFVAGDPARLASIKIRCRDIAERLGCACYFNAKSPAEVPLGYKAYLCVKPDFGAGGVESLSKKGAVIWDILDDAPPTEYVEAYITSTKYAARFYRALGNVYVIPHYHCNFERYINPGDNRTVGYIGNEHWYPDSINIKHERYFIHGWTREQVGEAYKKVGLAINLRKVSPLATAHMQINSGVKLLNCLGYGLPSISADEPAYREFGADCTIFTDISGCAQQIEALVNDKMLYEKLRRRCLERAAKFHIDEITAVYKEYFRRL